MRSEDQLRSCACEACTLLIEPSLQPLSVYSGTYAHRSPDGSCHQELFVLPVISDIWRAASQSPAFEEEMRLSTNLTGVSILSDQNLGRLSPKELYTAKEDLAHADFQT